MIFDCKVGVLVRGGLVGVAITLRPKGLAVDRGVAASRLQSSSVWHLII